MIIGGGCLVAAFILWLLRDTSEAEGEAKARATQAEHDAAALKKADAVVMKEVTDDELDKNLRDGSF
jgi:hypothetical protein